MEYLESEAHSNYEHSDEEHGFSIYNRATTESAIDMPKGGIQRIGDRFILSTSNKKNSFEVCLINAHSEKRSSIEEFISETFLITHAATVSCFLPQIFGAFDKHDQPQAAVGFKPITQQALFLETYTPRPIEQVLSRHVQRNIPRSRMAEVGNLSSQHPGACKKLFLLLVLYFYEQGIDWAVFTGTHAVRMAFKSIGLNTIILLEADKEKLGADQSLWGSYYENCPLVMACDIQKGMGEISNDLKLLGH